MEVVTPIHPAQSHWFGECHSTVVMASPDPLVPGANTQRLFPRDAELRFAMEGLLQARSRSCRREKLSPFAHGVRAAISVIGAGGCYNEYCRDNGGILLLPSSPNSEVLGFSIYAKKGIV